jgi:hypothetical protein
MRCHPVARGLGKVGGLSLEKKFSRPFAGDGPRSGPPDLAQGEARGFALRRYFAPAKGIPEDPVTGVLGRSGFYKAL